MAEVCTRECTEILAKEKRKRSEAKRKYRRRWKTRLDIPFKGITLKVTVNLRRRSGRWYVRFTLDGRQWERSTGETDRDKALCKISEIVKQVAHEIELGLTDKTKAVTTLSELEKRYRPYALANKASSTVEREKYTIRTLLKTFGDRKLVDITSQDIERYMQKRKQEVMPASVNRELALLRHMLNKACGWGYLEVNPARRVKPFKEPRGRIRWLSETEFERLLDTCKLSKNPVLYPIVLTALNTGMRKGELQKLTWDDVNLTERTITVKQTKNNEPRHIPISDELLPVLKALLNERPHSHYVFSKPDGTAYGNWRRSFETACRQAGIKNFRFHDLRHTFASYLGMSGSNVFEIKALTGHKTLAMVDRYTHISDDRLRAAVNKIRAKLGQHKSETTDNLTSSLSS